MGSNSVTFELRAEDLGATATAERVGGAVTAQQDKIAAREQVAAGRTRKTAAEIAALEQAAAVRARQHEAAVASAERQQRRLANAIGGSTSAAGLAASAVSSLRGMLLSLPMAAVAGATAALTAVLIQQIAKWVDLETAASRAQKTLDSIGRTTAASVAPALKPIQTRIEEINRSLSQLGNFAPLAATRAVMARLEAERDHLTRLRDVILGPKPTEQEIGVGANQEAIGRRIQQQAKLEFEARGAAQEQLGAWIQQQAKLEFEARGTIQEERGRQIAEAAQRELADRGAHQEALGQQIQDAARYELAVRQQTAEQAAAIEQMKSALIQNAMGAAAGILGQKSKALFLVSKALYVGQAVMAAFTAANMARARPHLTAADQEADAAITLKLGLANAAIVAATQLATSFSGGGGGGGGGGSSSPSSVPANAREIGPGAQPQPIKLVIHFNSTVTDRASVEAFFSDNIGLVGQIIKERSGQAGPVRLTYET